MRKAVALIMIIVASLAAAIGAENALDATTSDGRAVVLFPDGTWRFKVEETGKPSGTDHSRPANSTAVFKGPRGFMEVWYDPDKWKSPSGIENPSIEFSVRHVSGDAYGMFIVERIEIPLTTLRDIALDNARKVAEDPKVLSEEERVVNGQPVLAVLVDVTSKGIPFKFLYYFWSGPEGACQLITYTPRNLFEEYQADMTNLLDGVIFKKQ